MKMTFAAALTVLMAQTAFAGALTANLKCQLVAKSDAVHYDVVVKSLEVLGLTVKEDGTGTEFLKGPQLTLEAGKNGLQAVSRKIDRVQSYALILTGDSLSTVAAGRPVRGDSTLLGTLEVKGTGGHEIYNARCQGALLLK